jgi:acyl-CoA reductase-like NAD-dependent aldehyde dehydrogenase
MPLASGLASLVSELKGERIDVPGGGTNFAIGEPYGVVGRLIPFNHPIQSAAAALAAPLAPRGTLSSSSPPTRRRSPRSTAAVPDALLLATAAELQADKVLPATPPGGGAAVTIVPRRVTDDASSLLV